MGRVTGSAGSFTSSGTITIGKEQATFASTSGLDAAGLGVAITFQGTALRKALTLVFDAGSRPGSAALPVVAHRADDGSWDVHAATRDASGHITFATKSFSINIPGWGTARKWFDDLTALLASGIAGRTAPLTCSGAPSWFHLDSVHSDLVHACATTNRTSDGTEVAEVQIKSNRGVSLEVDVPGDPSYVWVDQEPWGIRQWIGQNLGYDPNRTVILPAGATMTIGYKRGNISVPWSFFVTGTTWKAATDTFVRDLADYLMGNHDVVGYQVFVAYSEFKCGTGFGAGPSGVSIGVNEIEHFLSCWTGQLAGQLSDRQTALNVASQFGIKSSEEAGAADQLAARAGAAKALGWLVTLWPAFQLGIGNDIDKINELLTGGGSALVTYHMDPAPQATSGGQPSQPQQAPSTAPAPSAGSASKPSAAVGPANAYDNYGPANAGHAMCRGNPGRPESVPGGTASQTFTVPRGVASLSSAMVQIDPDSSVTAHLTVYVNGSPAASASASAAGDTHFSFGPVGVRPGDTVTISITFSATYGKIITVYTAGSPGGLFTASNSCSDGAPNVSTTTTGLRATVSGTS